MSKIIHCIMTYGAAGTVGTIKIQKPESEKIVPDLVREPQTYAKATLRFDEAGRNQLALVFGSSQVD